MSRARSCLVTTFLFLIALFAGGCARKPDEPQPKQKGDGVAIIPGPTDDHTIQPAPVGTTRLLNDGTEELDIPLRETTPPRVEMEEEESEYGIYGFPAERRPVGKGVTRIRGDGKEELEIPLRER